MRTQGEVCQCLILELVYLVHQLNKVLFKHSYLFSKFKWFFYRLSFSKAEDFPLVLLLDDFLQARINACVCFVANVIFEL